MRAGDQKTVRNIIASLLMYKRYMDEVKEKSDDFTSKIESIRDKEQEFYDNLPESQQDGDRGERKMEIVDELESAVDELETVSSNAEEASDSLDSIIESLKTTIS